MQIDSPVETVAVASTQAPKPVPSKRPLFGFQEITVACWVVFVVFLLVPIGIQLSQSVRSGHFLDREKDFVFFYSMGRILNEYPPQQLYDLELQKKVERAIRPAEYTPNPYPPYVGVLFRPFARLSYGRAFLVWQGVSLCLYLAGLFLVAPRFFPNDPWKRSLIFCLALSYFPFLWIMNGGQIPTIGFLGFALAICGEDRGRPFRSGVGLSLCLYKPSLFILVLPMLLISKRYRTVGGLAAGGAALVGLTTILEGADIWPPFLRILFSFGSKAVVPHGYRALRYYVDLSAFSAMLPGGRSLVGGGVLAVFALIAVLALVALWRRSVGVRGRSGTLVWAVTLTWTFLLNVYAPIYDSIFLVIGVVITTAALQEFPGGDLRRNFNRLWVLIMAGAWFTVPLADSTGIQILTLLFVLLGTTQMIVLRRVLRGSAPGREDPVLSFARGEYYLETCSGTV